MVVIIHTACKNIIFTFISCKFEWKWTVCWSFTILLFTFISWLTFLASVTVKHINTISIWIEPFCSLRYHFNILRWKYLRNFVSDLKHIWERHHIKWWHVYMYYLVIVLWRLRIAIWLLLVVLYLRYRHNWRLNSWNNLWHTLQISFKCGKFEWTEGWCNLQIL